jgi:hypothetical protein
MTRQQVRNRVRSWFGKAPVGSDSERKLAKAQRLARDAARWAGVEARAQRERKEAEMEADEIFRLLLEERRAIFPNDL